MKITLEEKEKLLNGEPIPNYFWDRDEKVWIMTSRLKAEQLADFLIALELVKSSKPLK